VLRLQPLWGRGHPRLLPLLHGHRPLALSISIASWFSRNWYTEFCRDPGFPGRISGGSSPRRRSRLEPARMNCGSAGPSVVFFG
jgi:hypothetical protein